MSYTPKMKPQQANKREWKEKHIWQIQVRELLTQVNSKQYYQFDNLSQNKAFCLHVNFEETRQDRFKIFR